MSDFFGFFVTIIFISALLFLVALFINSEACENKAISFEDYDYKVLGGCMVKHNGKWLPLDNIRGFGDK